MNPHHRYTLPPKQAKSALKSSLFEQNKHTIVMVILWLPTFWSQKFYDPPIFLSKKKNDIPSIFVTPSSGENDSPIILV